MCYTCESTVGDGPSPLTTMEVFLRNWGDSLPKPISWDSELSAEQIVIFGAGLMGWVAFGFYCLGNSLFVLLQFGLWATAYGF